MRQRIRISPERYFVVAAVALVALTVIVFTGAAVRVTGSGLGCPHWPECYSNGRLVAELNSHAWIEFGNRMFTGFVALAAIAAGLLAFFRVPFRRDLAVLGVLLPLGVVGQAVMGGLTVLYGLAPGWVMGHYLLSMTILVAAGALAWRARPAFGAGEEPAADRATARAVWVLFALGGVTIFAGTAATAAGPHAGGEGTGDVVHRFTFKGSSTANWLIDRHGVLAAALGVLAVATWWLARRREADRELRTRLTRICLLLAAQGVVGILQFQLNLPAEVVWVHVALATLTWVGIVLAAMQVGAPSRAPGAPLRAAGGPADERRERVGAGVLDRQARQAVAVGVGGHRAGAVEHGVAVAGRPRRVARVGVDVGARDAERVGEAVRGLDVQPALEVLTAARQLVHEPRGVHVAQVGVRPRVRADVDERRRRQVAQLGDGQRALVGGYRGFGSGPGAQLRPAPWSMTSGALGCSQATTWRSADPARAHERASPSTVSRSGWSCPWRSSRRTSSHQKPRCRATWPVETKTVAGTPAFVSMGSARRMVSA